jgi:hypothetical protein
MYKYSYKIGNGQVSLTLVSDKGIGIWSATQPTYTEDHAGELVPDPTLVDAGVMSDFADTEGLKKYLVQQSIITGQDEIKLKK